MRACHQKAGVPVWASVLDVAWYGLPMAPPGMLGAYSGGASVLQATARAFLRPLVIVWLTGAACTTDLGPPLFPVDYTTTYQQVRNCRFSLEHDLVRVRVLASPEALTPYTGRSQPFPTGAIVLKEQYKNSDTSCGARLISAAGPGSGPES